MANVHEATGHETSDASVRTVAYTLVGLAIGAAIAAMIVYGIFWYLADNPLRTAPPNPLAGAEGQQTPPAPRIEAHPTVELQELRDYENKILNTYGWTNKAQGVVRIPIDRAMDLQMQKGFPTK